MVFFVVLVIDDVCVCVYCVLIDWFEVDGIYVWIVMMVVVVEIDVGFVMGFGYMYMDVSVVLFVMLLLVGVLCNWLVVDILVVVDVLWCVVCNVGCGGIVVIVILVFDVVLWDVKVKFVDVLFVLLFGCLCECVLVYGSGGFMIYDVLMFVV